MELYGETRVGSSVPHHRMTSDSQWCNIARPILGLSPACMKLPPVNVAEAYRVYRKLGLKTCYSNKKGLSPWLGLSPDCMKPPPVNVAEADRINRNPDLRPEDKPPLWKWLVPLERTLT